MKRHGTCKQSSFLSLLRLLRTRAEGSSACHPQSTDSHLQNVQEKKARPATSDAQRRQEQERRPEEEETVEVCKRVSQRGQMKHLVHLQSKRMRRRNTEKCFTCERRSEPLPPALPPGSSDRTRSPPPAINSVTSPFLLALRAFTSCTSCMLLSERFPS